MAQTPRGRPETSPAPPAEEFDWRAEYAYTAGVQAFIYGFPYIYNAKIRHDWVTSTQDPAAIPHGAVNQFWHASRILDATYRAGGCPSTDSLYSLAWLNVGEEPFILTHPDMGDRYFTFQLASFTSDNFGYIGQRTTGPGAGHFAIVGPRWDGALPPGVQRLRPSPTPWALVLGRTAVNGSDDLADARALQGQYRLTPLSAWNAPAAVVPVPKDIYAPVPATEDPLGPWKTLNAMLAENPPSSTHALVLEQFSGLGVGAGLDVEAQPEAVRRGLARAAAVGMALLRDQFTSGEWATIVNGWRYPPPEEGRFGNDFLRRAADQSLAGIAANDPAESMYLMNIQDINGARLDPKHRYTLRFPPDGLPPVDAFWSLTAYSAGDLNLIANPIDRYTVGDHASQLQLDGDGGLSIYLQPDPPADERESNWLPTSPESPWFVLLRMYRPRPEALDGSWRCPGISRAD